MKPAFKILFLFIRVYRDQYGRAESLEGGFEGFDR
jgi:hypothetical protein